MVRSRQALGIFWNVCLLSAFVSTLGAQPRVSALAEKPPADLAPAIASLLQATGVKAGVGDATLDIWWVQSIGSDGGWSGVESGTLVGAIRVTGAFKEIRGKAVAPGVYTLRYGQQPQNGDHLGISPYRDFLLLSPASVDKDPKVLGFDGVVFEVPRKPAGTIKFGLIVSGVIVH